MACHPLPPATGAHRPHRQRRLTGARQNGLSLLEMLVSLALLAILSCLALPALESMLDRQRLAEARQGLLDAVRLARESAIRQHVPVVLCPSRDGHACTDDRHWEHGWRIAATTIDAPPMRVEGAYPPPLLILASSGRHRLRLLADGSAEGYNLSLSFCLAGREDTPVWALIVNRAGRSYLAPAAAEQASACRAALREVK